MMPEGGNAQEDRDQMTRLTSDSGFWKYGAQICKEKLGRLRNQVSLKGGNRCMRRGDKEGRKDSWRKGYVTVVMLTFTESFAGGYNKEHDE